MQRSQTGNHVPSSWQTVTLGPQIPAAQGWSEEDALPYSPPWRPLENPSGGGIQGVALIPFICFGTLIPFVWVSR